MKSLYFISNKRKCLFCICQILLLLTLINSRTKTVHIDNWKLIYSQLAHDLCTVDILGPFMIHRAGFTVWFFGVGGWLKGTLNVVSTTLSCPTVVHLAQTGQPGGVLYPVGQQSRVTERASRMEKKCLIKNWAIKVKIQFRNKQQRDSVCMFWRIQRRNWK